MSNKRFSDLTIAAAVTGAKAPFTSPSDGKDYAFDPSTLAPKTYVDAADASLQTSVNGKAPASHVGTGGSEHPAATTSVAGFLSAADKTKLDGVATNATANATDAQLRDRGSHTGSQLIATITGLQTALDGKAVVTDIGNANGIAPLGSDSKVPSAYLPSYVDDVIEGASLGAFPGTGETGKIYTALDTGKIYRWSGSAYVEISPSPGSTDAVPEGATNLYHTSSRVNTLIAAALGVSVQAYSATLAALSALSTTTFGRSLLTQADAGATRTTLGLGSLATASSVTALQVSDSTSAGRAVLTAADAAAQTPRLA